MATTPTYSRLTGDATEALPRPYVDIPTSYLNPAPQSATGPYNVSQAHTHRIIGICDEMSREFWERAGYIVG